ncbi:MAG: hypothetical protein ACK4PK_12395 [Alphaproteobacteria bacterium]|jgi:hypothetical protein
MSKLSTLIEAGGCCRKDFGAAVALVQPQEPVPMPEHLICPCYRPKKNAP